MTSLRKNYVLQFLIKKHFKMFHFSFIFLFPIRIVEYIFSSIHLTYASLHKMKFFCQFFQKGTFISYLFLEKKCHFEFVNIMRIWNLSSVEDWFVDSVFVLGEDFKKWINHVLLHLVPDYLYTIWLNCLLLCSLHAHDDSIPHLYIVCCSILCVPA